MPKITIYTTSTCPYCHALKQYLDSKNTPYNEILIDNDVYQAIESLDTCGSMGTPCTHVTLDDGKEISILGFNRARIDEALGFKDHEHASSVA